LTVEPISNADLRARIAALEAEIRGLKAGLPAEPPMAYRSDDARFRETFERAAAGVAHVGLTGAFLTVNKSLCDILGYSEEELLARTFQEITHPDDLAPDLALVARLLAGEIDRFHMEKRYLRPTGEVVWADLTVALERDDEGDPRNFISVVTDITARKQNEDRLNFLLGELAHRSKNLLAVLQSAVRQIGADAQTVREFKEAVDDRILGIAAAQDVLVRRDFEAAPIAELVQGQLSGFVQPADPRLRLEGPDVNLGAAAAQSLGLALHELATNACKYGALSAAEGLVVVEWSLPERERFRMSWTERGGPPVEPPTRSGFGRRVIEQMVATSLCGEVDLRFEPEGLVWRLEAPVASLRG
jgi:PAS domain S-box-containing protein